MRTRLDEIVEEEIPRESHYTAHAEVVRTWGKRIAERAFQHGCEMGGMAAVRNCEQIRLGKAPEYGGETVQPAPAEEKLCGKCRHPEHDGICLFMLVDIDRFGLMTTPSGTCNCGDRRKGKRRAE
jgi:hypothetical protein